MLVAPGDSLCLDYGRCAYLGDDTDCSRVNGGGYGYGTYGTYAGESGCVGNATWATVAPSGDPECGQTHAVRRCAPVGQACAIVNGVTLDFADP
jgi:hypothetical protein